jgi:hypothetical protein
MKAFIVSLAAILMIGLVPVSFAEVPDKEPSKPLAALEQKMLGAWMGQTGCAGNHRFRADGTYQLTGYGPAPYDSAGTWRVRCDTRPATLILTCRTSEIPEEVGTTTEMKLIQLDADTLAIQRAKQDVERYARVKE